MIKYFCDICGTEIEDYSLYCVPIDFFGSKLEICNGCYNPQTVSKIRDEFSKRKNELKKEVIMELKNRLLKGGESNERKTRNGKS